MKIASWNVRSIRNAHHEIEELTERICLDIIALQETDVSNGMRFSMSGYKIYYNDKTRRRGVTALLGKKTSTTSNC